MTAHSLLSAVLADPFDDGPRLVCADWLEENDEPERAEFIRTQIDDPEADQWELLFDLAYVFFPDAEGEYCNQPKNTIKILHADKSKVEYVFRRGFPDEIRCTMVQWVGGECGRCHGRGFLGGPAPGQHGWIGAPTCPRCHGTGRTPGIAKQVCEAWPVTRVVLTDVNPRPELGFRIELELLNVLNFPHTTWWPTKAEAIDALSHAAVNYGRRLAGLPELKQG